MVNTNIDVFLGLEVGKTDHWAWAVTQDGTKIWNKTLPNDEANLIAVYQNLIAQGTVLVAVEQPAIIVALAVAVAQQLGIQVAYPLRVRLERYQRLIAIPPQHVGDAQDS